MYIAIFCVDQFITYLCFCYCLNYSGLVTLDQMKAKQEDVIRKREAQLAKKDAQARLVEEQNKERKRKEKMKVKWKTLC